MEYGGVEGQLHGEEGGEWDGPEDRGHPGIYTFGHCCAHFYIVSRVERFLKSVLKT